MKLVALGASALVLAMAAAATPAAAEQEATPTTTHQNPWNANMTGVTPLRVRDPKAALMLSVAEGREPVFEITIEDIGLYFGYLIPAHVAGFETTRLALELLYPEGMPLRGQVRVAGPEKNDIMLVASYLTGARDFYLVEDKAGGDLVIDPTLGADRPGKYVMIFQREDTGRTVEAVFDRPALVPDNRGAGDYGNTAPVYINLLNGRTPEGDPAAHERIITGPMDLILAFDHEKLYSARVIDGYDFPTTGRLDPLPATLTGPVGAWFAAAEAMDATTYAGLFARDGRLTIGSGDTVTGPAAIEATAKAFFGSIGGLDHHVRSVWSADAQTIIEGRVVYTVNGGETVSVPMTVIVDLDPAGESITEAKVFIDSSPLFAAIDPS